MTTITEGNGLETLEHASASSISLRVLDREYPYLPPSPPIKMDVEISSGSESSAERLSSFPNEVLGFSSRCLSCMIERMKSNVLGFCMVLNYFVTLGILNNIDRINQISPDVLIYLDNYVDSDYFRNWISFSVALSIPMLLDLLCFLCDHVLLEKYIWHSPSSC